MGIAPLSPVEILSKDHILEDFDSGEPSLDHWLKACSRINQSKGISQVFVVHRANVVVGYYSLSMTLVKRDDAPLRQVKRLPKVPELPAALLGRLAVVTSEQGNGIGPAMLKDALLRVNDVSDAIGVCAVLVHALHDKAKGFYEHFGFEESPIQELQMTLSIKDLRASLKE